jgi:hypothetical protein
VEVKRMQDIGNIFEKGCLVNLSIGTLGNSKQLTTAEKARISKAKTTKKDRVKAGKVLLNPESLEAIEKNKNAARTWLRKRTLPFPIKGVFFVGYDDIEVIDKVLSRFQLIQGDLVEKFTGEFPELKEAAKEDLKLIDNDGNEIGTLYNEGDYPTDVSRCFRFEWRFVTMEAPGQNTAISPDFVNREREKFMSLCSEAQEVALTALREEFSSIVSNCVERLTPNADGTRRKFKRSLVGNFTEFFETFKTRNVFDDEALRELVEKAEAIVGGVGFEALRDNEALRETVQVNMATVAGQLEEALQEGPRRKLRT